MFANATIVIPCYNHNALLVDALSSISQLVPLPQKVVIVDDGSVEPVSVEVDEFPTQIHVARQSNQGLSAARNTGLRHVDTQWVLFLDADDRLYPNALEHLPSADDECNVDVFISAYTLVKDGVETNVFPQMGDPVAALLRGNPGPIHSYCFNMNKVSTLTFDESDLLRVGHEDYDFLCQLALAGGRFCSVHQVTCEYIKRHGSMSSNKSNMDKTRAIAWSRLVFSCEICTTNRLMAALDFVRLHWEHITELPNNGVSRVIEKLKLSLQRNIINKAEVNYLLDSLPDNTEASQLKKQMSISSTPFPSVVFNESLDWRMLQASKAIALHRVNSMIAKYSTHDSKVSLVVWGANDIAAQIIPICRFFAHVSIADSNKVGSVFLGEAVLGPNDVDYQSTDVYFVAAHNSYNQVVASLVGSGVSMEAIF